MHKLLWSVLSSFLVLTSPGQEVTRFIELYNQGKIEDIQAEATGYISLSFLRNRDSVVGPITNISKEDAGKLISGFLEDFTRRAKKDGEIIRENDLQRLESKQKKLNIAWKELHKEASNVGVKITLARYTLKREEEPQVGILVMHTHRGILITATELDGIASNVDIENETLEVPEVWKAEITALRIKIEQDGADQPATAPELKSESKDKPQPEKEVAPR